MTNPFLIQNLAPTWSAVTEILKGDSPGHPFRGNQYTTDLDRNRIALHTQMGNGHAADAIMTRGAVKQAFKKASTAHFKASDAWKVAALTPEGSPERAKAQRATVKAQEASVNGSYHQDNSPFAR